MGTDTTDFDYSPMTVPPSAIFVAADEPLLVYPSVVAAECRLDVIDVRSGVYTAAYGPNGEPYRIDADGNHVVIELSGEPCKPDELTKLLLQYLEGIGRSSAATTALDELATTVWMIERNFWQEHDPYGDRFGTRISMWGCLGLAAVVALIFYLLTR